MANADLCSVMICDYVHKCNYFRDYIYKKNYVRNVIDIIVTTQT